MTLGTIPFIRALSLPSNFSSPPKESVWKLLESHFAFTPPYLKNEQQLSLFLLPYYVTLVTDVHGLKKVHFHFLIEPEESSLAVAADGETKCTEKERNGSRKSHSIPDRTMWRNGLNRVVVIKAFINNYFSSRGRAAVAACLSINLLARWMLIYSKALSDFHLRQECLVLSLFCVKGNFNYGSLCFLYAPLFLEIASWHHDALIQGGWCSNLCLM